LTAYIQVPSSTIISGFCAEDGTDGTDDLIITMFNSWTLSFGFQKAPKALHSSFELDYISLMYIFDSMHFPNISTAMIGGWNKVNTDKLGLFVTSQSGSFRCHSDLVIELPDMVTVTLHDTQFRAFGTDNSTGFSENSKSLTFIKT